jgi:hypothetical protein
MLVIAENFDSPPYILDTFLSASEYYSSQKCSIDEARGCFGLSLLQALLHTTEACKLLRPSPLLPLPQHGLFWPSIDAAMSGASLLADQNCVL